MKLKIRTPTVAKFPTQFFRLAKTSPILSQISAGARYSQSRNLPPMPAKSRLPACLLTCFPSSSRQFYVERLNSLPREPPSSPIARGIPFVLGATVVRAWLCISSPSLSLELNLLLSINCHQRCRLHPSTRQIPFVLGVSSTPSTVLHPLHQRSPLNRSCTCQLAVVGCWIPSL